MSRSSQTNACFLLMRYTICLCVFFRGRGYIVSMALIRGYSQNAWSADSLRSHVVLHEWLACYSTFLNIHRSGVLTALAWLVPHETAAVSAQVLCTPYNHGPKQNAWCNKTSIMPGLHPAKVLFMTWQTPLLKLLMLECSCWGSRQHCNATHGYASACRCGGNGCTHSPLTLHWVNLQITLLMYVCMYDSACRCGGNGCTHYPLTLHWVNLQVTLLMCIWQCMQVWGKWLHTLPSHPTLGEPAGNAAYVWQCMQVWGKRLHTLPSHPTLHEPAGNTAYLCMTVHAGVGETAAHTTLSPYTGWTYR